MKEELHSGGARVLKQIVCAPAWCIYTCVCVCVGLQTGVPRLCVMRAGELAYALSHDKCSLSYNLCASKYDVCEDEL